MILQRKKSYETSRKKKISLPAALFNRSPSNVSENSSMISNNSQTNMDIVCYNHPAKKGKYTVVTQEQSDGQETLYCEKCAILLASRGFEVQKINQETSSNHSTVKKSTNNPRERQLKQFLMKINQKLINLSKSQESVNIMLQEMEQKCSEEKQNIQFFIDSVINLLEKKKHTLLHSNDMKNRDEEEELKTDLDYLNQSVEMIQTMKQDIESSLECIVKDTTEQDYRLVMAHYQNNLQEIKEDFASLKNESLKLPSLENAQKVLNQMLDNGQSSTLFSFDSSTHNFQ